jgi:hypothetical protein
MGGIKHYATPALSHLAIEHQRKIMSNFASSHENPAKSRSLSPDLAVSRTNAQKGEQK